MTRNAKVWLLALTAMALAWASVAWGQSKGVTYRLEGAEGSAPRGWNTEHTTLSGPVQSPSSWKLQGQGLDATGPRGGVDDVAFLLLSDVKAVDVDVSVRMQLRGTGLEDGHTWAGVVARYQDPANYYAAQIDWEKDAQVAEFKHVLDNVDKQIVEVDIGDRHPYRYPSDWFELRLRLEGDRATMFLDGKEIWSDRTGIFRTAGQVGLFVSPQAQVRFESVKVTDLKGSAPAAQGPTFSTPAGWKAETVARGRLHRQSALALDADGKAHVSFYDLDSSSYQYATNAGGAWKVETVDDGKRWGGRFDNRNLPPAPLTAIAVDSRGAPAILYCTAFEGPSKVQQAGAPLLARKGENAWNYEALDTGVLAWYPALTAGARGRTLTAAYFDWRSGSVRLARQRAGAWENIQVARTDGTVGRGSHFRIGLAASHQGPVDLAFSSETNDTLIVARSEGNAFRTDELSLDKEVGGNLSMARDSQGVVHLSHYSTDAQVLLYSTWADGKWSTTTVDSHKMAGVLSSLAVDSRDRPHIAYCDFRTGAIKYAILSGGSWKIEDTGLSGLFPSLALDAAGRPHLTYYDPLADAIRYARK